MINVIGASPVPQSSIPADPTTVVVPETPTDVVDSGVTDNSIANAKEGEKKKKGFFGLFKKKNEKGGGNKKRKRKIPLKYVLGGLGFLLLIIGGGAGLYLTRVNQDLRQQASVVYDNQCENPNNFGDFVCRDGKCAQCGAGGATKEVSDQTRSECPSECRTGVATPTPTRGSGTDTRRGRGDMGTPTAYCTAAKKGDYFCQNSKCRVCNDTNSSLPISGPNTSCPSECRITSNDLASCDNIENVGKHIFIGDQCTYCADFGELPRVKVVSDSYCKSGTEPVASCPTKTTSYFTAELCLQNCKVGSVPATCTLPTINGVASGTEDRCCQDGGGGSGSDGGSGKGGSEDVCDAGGNYKYWEGDLCVYCNNGNKTTYTADKVQAEECGTKPTTKIDCTDNKNEYVTEGGQCIYCDNDGRITYVPTSDERYENCPGSSTTDIGTPTYDQCEDSKSFGDFVCDANQCIQCTSNGGGNKISSTNTECPETCGPNKIGTPVSTTTCSADGNAWEDCNSSECKGKIDSTSSCQLGWNEWVCGNKKWVPTYQHSPVETACSYTTDNGSGGTTTTSCGWPLTNGQCCPTGNDACSNIGDIICIDDPFAAECKLWSTSCPAGQQNYYQAFKWSENFEDDIAPLCDGKPASSTTKTTTTSTKLTPLPTPTIVTVIPTTPPTGIVTDDDTTTTTVVDDYGDVITTIINNYSGDTITTIIYSNSTVTTINYYENAPTTKTVAYTQSSKGGIQPELPEELYETGPEDWLTYLKVGLGALGIGAILLLFL